MRSERESREPEKALYRLEVGGRVAESRPEWFEAEAILPAGNNTVLHVRVADQAELFGRLRRIHDLNLRLVSVTRVDPEEPGLDPQREHDSDG